MNADFRKLLIVAYFSLLAGCSSVQQADDGKAPFTEFGQASFYGDKHENEKTASGEIYRHVLNTAAHRKLAFGSTVKVTNIDNGKSVIVRINDRGPFINGRIIDLSKSAFASIGTTSSGLIEVKIETIAASP